MRVPYETLTPAVARAALAACGFGPQPAALTLEAREERWLVRLPEERRLAWFAASARGRARLEPERSVLRLIAARCGFRVPRILVESADGDLDARAIVPGTDDPWGLYVAVRDRDGFGARIGAAVGAILAEQHCRIRAPDAAGWLPARPSWPESAEWVAERIETVVDDARLAADARAVMAAYERVHVAEVDRVLVHGDLGLHNLAVDPRTEEVCGVFDYEGAAWADRHHDFRYLVFDFDGNDVLEAALSVYEPIVRLRRRPLIRSGT